MALNYFKFFKKNKYFLVMKMMHMKYAKNWMLIMFQLFLEDKVTIVEMISTNFYGWLELQEVF